MSNQQGNQIGDILHTHRSPLHCGYMILCGWESKLLRHSVCDSPFQDTSPQTKIGKKDQNDSEESEKIEPVDAVYDVVSRKHQTAEQVDEDHVEKYQSEINLLAFQLNSRALGFPRVQPTGESNEKNTEKTL